jgi:hypothetical protein
MASGLLTEIAINTGGEAFLQVNHPERLLRRVVSAQSAHYLQYQSTQNPSDGKFHKIDLRVKRRGPPCGAQRLLASADGGRARKGRPSPPKRRPR